MSGVGAAVGWLQLREKPMWDEIQDMMGEIFDIGDITDDIPEILSMDIDDRDAMPLDMQEDIVVAAKRYTTLDASPRLLFMVLLRASGNNLCESLVRNRPPAV